MESQKKVILLPEPCKAKWSAMHKVEGGRFCDLCSKKVHDFRGWETTAIIQKIETSEEEICGKFNPKALYQKPIKMPTFFNTFKWTAVLGSFLVFLVSTCKTRGISYGGAPVVCNNDTLYLCEHKDMKNFDYEHKPNIHEPKYKNRRPCKDDQDIDDTK
jgi:hypothetical protein